MDRLDWPDQRDRRIAAVLGEVAELGRRIGELAGELARLTAERCQSAASGPCRSDRTAGVVAAAGDLAAHAARVVAVQAGAKGRRTVFPPTSAGRGGRRLAGPIAASAIVHLVAIIALSAVFVAVESPKTPVTITLSEAAEVGFDESPSAEFDAFVEPVEPMQAEDSPQLDAIDPPREELLVADPPPLPPEPLDGTPLDDVAAAVESSSPAAAPVVAAPLVGEVDGEDVGGKAAAAATPRAVPRGRQSAAFFGRVGQGKSVCFICDNSNSYRDGRFHAVLDELMRAVQGLRPDQSFFVIFTSDAAYPLFHPEPVAGLQPATAENKRRLRAWLGTVEMCSGGKGIDDAVRLATKLNADCVYLLSDGELAAGTVDRLEAADFGGAAVHTFGMQGSIIDARTGQVDRGKLFRQGECNRNLGSIAAAHGGTFTPVIVPAAAAALERLRPIPRNRSRGAVWGVRL